MAKRMVSRFVSVLLLLVCLLGLPSMVKGQGTLEDYQRAARFETGWQRKLITDSTVQPHWIEKTSRFWYRTSGPDGAQFVLVDPTQNTSEPAFDQAKLAAALSAAAKQEYKADKLPFETFEFADGGKAIHVTVSGKPWTCTLTDYKCSPGPEPKDPYES
jgi:hypothetical protein